jgi:hypothetical protein
MGKRGKERVRDNVREQEEIRKRRKERKRNNAREHGEMGR